MADGAVLVVGGTGGIGREVARNYAQQGHEVILTGRDADRAGMIAADIGDTVRGIAVDLAQPEAISEALAGVGPVAYLVITAVDRDENPVKEYDIGRAMALTTMKLVGYTEVVHTLLDRLSDDSSVVLYGGRAKDRPYPGSTTVTTVNGGVSALIRTLAVELAPIRFNSLHPGIVGDSPYWENKPLDAVIARTPTKRLPTMAEVVDATAFLLENRAINGVNLYIDGGWMLM
ncbi:MAG: SDR family oxidoreductase [Acidimicrobiia bacterium]|jgi:NAD(P)-dependent dehydrogenase (short-subunit alcohol dehydrogenase family)